MPITTDERRRAWRRLSALIRGSRFVPLDRLEMEAAVDAAVLWIENNEASFNAALPTAARTELTTDEKVALFIVALEETYGGDRIPRGAE
jgi:hypothetical protein